MPPPSFRLLLVLGLLTAIGPFAVDMYVPVLPVIGLGLHAGPDAVQASLMAFFLALGGGQLIAGPLSDMHGRKPPIYIGLALFIAASIGCALAPTIGWLVALRFLQGLGACGCMVTPRAVVRDMAAGPEAARLMSVLLVIYSVSPIFAPLIGSLVGDAFGWRALFVAVAALAVAAFFMTRAWLPETRLPPARMNSSFASAIDGYLVLLRDRGFLAAAAMGSINLGGFFVFVANSPFVMSAHWGVTPRMYALLFALNAVSFIAASRLNGRLAARFGLHRSILVAVVCQALTMFLLLALTLAGVDRLGVMVGLLFIGWGFNGVVMPSSFVLAMEGHPKLGGTASALIGTMNFAGGAVMVAAASPFANGTPRPMLSWIAGCSGAVLVIAWRTLWPRIVTHGRQSGPAGA
jgi:DHA1 family bicyclomycin/chloramphenicol resistance-like MFS transporter